MLRAPAIPVIGLALVLSCMVAGAPAALARQASADGWPRVAARAAVVIDARSGEILYGHRPFDELPPASLTKMMTALVAVERAGLDLRVEPQQTYDVEPILIGIEPGDSLRLEDALYGLLLNSGNDAGMAIAESVGQGSIPRFVDWMNELARRLGLAHTRFRNPHGLDEDSHVSSAYDMAVIGRALMREPVLARIVGERRRLVEGPPRWLFQTTNPLLGRYDGADGIKTGYEVLAGRCLVATAVRDGRRAIAVVLNSDRHAADAAVLLDAAFADPSWGEGGRAASALAAADVPSPGMVRADLGRPVDGVPWSVFRTLRAARAAERAG